MTLLAIVGVTAAFVAGWTLKSRRLELRLEDEAREKSLMTSVMDSIADGVVLTDVAGGIRLVNPKAREILGLQDVDAGSENAIDLVSRCGPATDGVVREQFRRVVEETRPVATEVTLSLPATRHYRLSLAPVVGADGRLHGIVAVLSDITHLKELSQMKTDLMSMVTHEIRTPLATVRGFAQILLRGGLGGEKGKEFLEIIHRQSGRLVDLVNDFLDITRIESGRHAMKRGPVDVGELIALAVADLRPLAEEKEITLEHRLTASLPRGLADGNMIEQVLINLISNAVKYSGHGARVLVEASSELGMVAVSVRDTGLGIPKECMPHLFEKFYRVRGEDRRDILGTGLGLSLAKQIVDVHGGTITVDSEHGEGSCFTFTIPACAREEKSAPATTAADPMAAWVN